MVDCPRPAICFTYLLGLLLYIIWHKLHSLKTSNIWPNGRAGQTYKYNMTHITIILLLLWIRTTSLIIIKKSREVFIKTRSPPASRSFQGQVAKQATVTVKWSIHTRHINIQMNVSAVPLKHDSSLGHTWSWDWYNIFFNYFQLTSGFNPSCPETYIVLSAITAWLEKNQVISKNKIYKGHSIFETTPTPKGGIILTLISCIWYMNNSEGSLLLC